MNHIKEDNKDEEKGGNVFKIKSNEKIFVVCSGCDSLITPSNCPGCDGKIKEIVYVGRDSAGNHVAAAGDPAHTGIVADLLKQDWKEIDETREKNDID